MVYPQVHLFFVGESTLTRAIAYCVKLHYSSTSGWPYRSGPASRSGLPRLRYFNTASVNETHGMVTIEVDGHGSVVVSLHRRHLGNRGSAASGLLLALRDSLLLRRRRAVVNDLPSPPSAVGQQVGGGGYCYSHHHQ
jgi:hypothetical protein